ncbi:MAG: ABC transporter substrate-binding protein, partial [Oscillospiraceae bacterium]|nr:ABC transporter substrate-binding protein [Oscillospiraceae bacterium]
EYMMRYVGAGAASVTDNVKEVDPAFFGQTATMSTDWATLQMWETNMIRDILMGTDDISSFDSFVNDWKANGGDQITAEVQAAVDAFASGS